MKTSTLLTAESENTMEKAFTYPAAIKGLGGILIVLSLILWGILLVVKIADPTTPVELILLATAFLAVFGLFGWMIIRSNSVVIILTQDGITFKDGRKQRFIQYGEITGVSHSSKVVASIILHTGSGNLAVKKNLVGYPDFVESLKPRIGTMQQDLGGILQIKFRAWEFYTAAGIFIGASAATLIAVLLTAAKDETGIPFAIFFSVILSGFILGLLYLTTKHPRQYDFAKNKITKTFLTGKTEYTVSEITSVQYGQKKPKSTSRYGSPVQHFIEINFSDKKKYIHIDQTLTDFPIDEIANYVQKNYPVENKFSEVRLGKK